MIPVSNRRPTVKPRRRQRSRPRRDSRRLKRPSPPSSPRTTTSRSPVPPPLPLPSRPASRNSTCSSLPSMQRWLSNSRTRWRLPKVPAAPTPSSWSSSKLPSRLNLRWEKASSRSLPKRNDEKEGGSFPQKYPYRSLIFGQLVSFSSCKWIASNRCIPQRHHLVPVQESRLTAEFRSISSMYFGKACVNDNSRPSLCETSKGSLFKMQTITRETGPEMTLKETDEISMMCSGARE